MVLGNDKLKYSRVFLAVFDVDEDLKIVGQLVFDVGNWDVGTATLWSDRSFSVQNGAVLTWSFSIREVLSRGLQKG